MNESIQTQLRILVERAVRTVRSSLSCKRKMREELLAHVTAVFEEEVARLADDEAALQRTAQRFGNCAELTDQLQESVPVTDALERFADWLSFRPGESTLRRAARYVVLIEVVALLFLVPVWLALRTMGEWPIEAVLEIGSVLLAAGYMVFSIVVLENCMRQSLNGTVKRPSLQSVLILFFLNAFPILAFGAWGSASGVNLKDRLVEMAVLMVGMIVWISFCSWSLAHVFTARMRYLEDWASLQID